MAELQRIAQRSNGSFSAERISRAHHQGTLRTELAECFQLCLAALRPDHTSRSISALRAAAPCWHTSIQASSPPKRFTASPTIRSNMVGDRKSTRLNSSHVKISYAVFCLK